MGNFQKRHSCTTRTAEKNHARGATGKKIELLSAKFYYPVPIFDVKKILAQVPT